jgi:hypothetical protein
VVRGLENHEGVTAVRVRVLPLPLTSHPACSVWGYKKKHRLTELMMETLPRKWVKDVVTKTSKTVTVV